METPDYREEDARISSSRPRRIILTFFVGAYTRMILA